MTGTASGPLNGRTAVVTGATRGIGRAIAERLQAQGAQVFGTGTSPAGDLPEGCEYLPANFLDEKSMAAFAGRLAELAPDILINNAGINELSPFAEIDPESFARVQRVNVTAPMLICRAALPGMRARGWGRIVNITSIWSVVVRAGRAPYAASKHALIGLTAALSAEAAKDGVLANCVAPGFIATELTRSNMSDADIAAVSAQVPVGRLGQPEEVAALVAWLAGPENTYVTGQNILCDGGFTGV